MLQETRWCRNQEEILLQHISGLQIASTAAIPTGGYCSSGGSAILIPAGWVITQWVVLLEGVAILVSDRSVAPRQELPRL